MILVGIPCYKAKDTLPKVLDSLVAQTSQNFITCLCIDCDGEDYSDIIETYRARGLKFKVIYRDENGGPGMVCQTILNYAYENPFKYVTFVDSDDMLLPRAIEILSNEIQVKDYDIVAGAFIVEKEDHSSYIMTPPDIPCTWRHGKIYKLDYLRNNTIEYLPELRINEDAYFNVIAWNGTSNRSVVTEPVYLWRYNKNSLTRKDTMEEVLRSNCYPFVYSQICGLVKLATITTQNMDTLISDTLINMYYHLMRVEFFKMDKAPFKELFQYLGAQPFIQDYLGRAENWIYMGENVKCAEQYADSLYFYQIPFNTFISDYIYNPAVIVKE